MDVVSFTGRQCFVLTSIRSCADWVLGVSASTSATKGEGGPLTNESFPVRACVTSATILDESEPPFLFTSAAPTPYSNVTTLKKDHRTVWAVSARSSEN